MGAYSYDVPGTSLSTDIYDFLLRSIRDADQREGNKFLWRFLRGPQAIWQQTNENIYSLLNLWNLTTCSDETLHFIKNILGWTSELDVITDQLDELTLRRLLSVSVQIWKNRSNETSISQIVNLLVGKRSRIDNWFYLRAILDETEIGQSLDEYECILLKEANAPYWSNIRIVDPGSSKHLLLRSVLKLMRPCNERFDITYLRFLDDFSIENDLSQWMSIFNEGGSLPTVSNGIFSFTNITDEIYGISEVGAGDWEDYCVNARVRITDVTGGYFSIVVYASGSGSTLVNGYEFKIDPFLGRYTILKDGSYFEYHYYYISEDVWHTFRVEVINCPTETQIGCYANGVKIFSVADSSGQYTKGNVYIRHVGCKADIMTIEVLPLPISIDSVDINS